MDPLQFIPHSTGRPLENVLAYEILSDVTRIADGFRVVLGATEGKPIASGDFLDVFYRSTQILAGRVDSTMGITTARQRRFRILGRDFGGALVDSAAPIVHFDEVGLEVIAAVAVGETPIRGLQIQGALGLVSELETRPQPEERQIGLRVHTEPGESKAQFLSRYLAYSDNIAWVDEAGNLVIGRPAIRDPSGRIRVGRAVTNVRSARVLEAPALALTEVQILQSPEFDLGESEPLELATARTTDPRLEGFSRRRLIQGPDQANLLEGRTLARNELARSAQDILRVEVEIPGHELDGILPRTDQTWRVDLDPDAIHRPMYLRATRYVREASGEMQTTLLFVDRDTIVSQFAGQERRFRSTSEGLDFL